MLFFPFFYFLPAASTQCNIIAIETAKIIIFGLLPIFYILVFADNECVTTRTFHDLLFRLQFSHAFLSIANLFTTVAI